MNRSFSRRAPNGDEFERLLYKSSTRLMPMLTRRGHLIEAQGMSHVVNIGADNPLALLQAGARAHRIAGWNHRVGASNSRLQPRRIEVT